MPWDFALIYAFLLIVAPWRGAVKVREILSADADERPSRQVIYVSSAASQWLLAAAVAWRAIARGFSWKALGVSSGPALLLVVLGIGIAAYLIAIQLLLIRRTLKLAPQTIKSSRTMLIMRRLMPETLGEAIPFVFLAFTAGICEEFLYRGFVYSHLMTFGGTAAALLGSSALFGVAHAYQGKQGVIGTLIIGLVLCAGRIWTGNLLPSVIAHFLFDLSAGFVVAKWVRRAALQTSIRAANPV